MNPTEPAADLRQMAAFLWQTFIALTSEGFSEQQALIIIGQILSMNQGGAA
jgi:hypothetical protein